MTFGRWAKSDKTTLLASIPLFSACSRRELAEVADISVEEQLDSGTVLTRQGQAGGLAFVVLDGEADVTVNGSHLGTLGPGDIAGELSLIDGRPRSAQVTARTPLRVLEVNADDFNRLIDRSPSFTKHLLVSLSRRIRDMDERWQARV